ncbi:putative bacterioferritin-associated ferredoxin [Magnetofaba australis IT-1]|uniref:Bacterioferritin-associated ferredoxin n=1 Tax=Magnetofaba australis IT-1 TaxID=1434232 RepID=A0A1Y2K174_9PROT|nr:putative bacterioferritin-associated ferredoxin [Magnetofaba australis IT-1]
MCICRGVTDHQIRQEIENGALSMADLNQRLGVAGQCGRCGQSAKSLLKSSGCNGCGKCGGACKGH